MKIGKEFEFNLPCYIIANIAPVTKMPTFATCGTPNGLAILVFTDEDLVRRHHESGVSPINDKKLRIDTAESLIALVRQLTPNTTHVVFDANF